MSRIQNPVKHKSKLPGIIATAIVIVVTSSWIVWGLGELYYEGWGQPFPQLLNYLIPGAIFLIFSLVSVMWPLAGGIILIAAGSVFSIIWSLLAFSREWFSIKWVLSTLLPFMGIFVGVGVLFIWESRYRRQKRLEKKKPKQNWFRRYFRCLLVLGLPMITAIAVSVYYSPLILSRVDDGERGARLIKGNDVTLVWAPQGPGWNQKKTSGVYPSWNDIALYGVEPVGFHKKPDTKNKQATQKDMDTTCICRYLSDDGQKLMEKPQNIWRMPTTEEVIRSLVSQGKSAECNWDGESLKADCQKQPNKGTPLWAPDQSPIYYWSRDEYDDEEAWYVPYTGGIRYGGVIHHQKKDWANPRHGYRCVREVKSIKGKDQKQY
ncbi:MAG: hypothetical protein GF421_04295 [Candidatus Aminicenantes bacterium]|nr:hypothetical protein [Candidatus Aminicenantes bacterium]